MSRNLYCYGYGEKPAWMLGKESWQEILDSDEARAIRKGAERAYSRRRQKNLRPVPWSAGVLVQGLKEPARSSQESSLGLRTGLDRTWSNCTQTLRDCDYAPDYSYIQTFLDVIFPLQWGFFDLNRQPGCSWLFDTILASEPMYHASCGLCITFESGLKAGNTNGRCEVTPEARASRLLALRGLQHYITEMQQEGLNKSFLRKAIHAVAVILLLSSLEIFADAEGAWEVHMNAAGTVLDLIETRIAASESTSGDIGSIGQLLSSLTPSFETRALEFFVTTYVWTDILAEATHGMTYSKPRDFSYLPLLQGDVIDTRSIMGCHNSVMIAIKEVSIFAASMRKRQHLNPAERAETLTLWIQDLIQEINSGLFGYDQGVTGGLLTLPSFTSIFPEICTTADCLSGLTSSECYHRLVIQGIVVASFSLGCFAGTITSLLFGDILGRRKSIFIGSIIMIIGAALQFSAFSIAQFVVGRVICGVGNGMSTSTVPLWQAECSKPHRRGMTVAFDLSQVIGGVMIAYWVDFGMSYTEPSSVAWRFPIALQHVFAIFVAATIFLMPESPRWLILKGEDAAAQSVLEAINNVPADHALVEGQLQAMRASLAISGESRLKDLITNGPTRNFHRVVLSYGIHVAQ
ncbi:Fc.00g011200.m01.CDS01 [Cosmosporella sp. VM-42]